MEIGKVLILHFSHTLVSLQAFMKNLVVKYVSALVAVWYCLSIIGFDVHSCSATGRVFVNSVLSGTTCEDVHPEHDCKGHGSCCGAHGCCSHEKADDGCCTNEIEVLDSEGVIAADDDVCDLAAFVMAYSCLTPDHGLQPVSRTADILYYPDPREFITPDLQAVLNIWRI